MAISWERLDRWLYDVPYHIYEIVVQKFANLFSFINFHFISVYGFAFFDEIYVFACNSVQIFEVRPGLRRSYAQAKNRPDVPDVKID